MEDPWDIAAALAGSVALEAATPGKPATVSSWMGSGGLTLADFILSVPYLARALGEALSMPPCKRVPKVLGVAGQVRASRIIGKNTIAGYVVLVAPLTPILEYLGEGVPEAINAHWGIVEECLRSIPAGQLIRAVDEGGVRHLHGFVSSSSPSSLWEEYLISSLYDINCWEVTAGYTLTREASVAIPCNKPTQEVVKKVFITLANKLVDTSVLKSLGTGWWLTTRTAIIRGRDDFLRRSSVNLGSIADLTALATAFWVIRCARHHR